MGDKRETPAAVKKIGRWLRSRSVREKVGMAAAAAVVVILLMKLFIRNNRFFFIATQLAHATGILVLTYKLTVTKTCSGLSLKTQELTAIFLVMRLLCFMAVMRDIHLVLDSLTLASTLWVIYMIRFKLKSTYMKELDNMPLYYVLVPCAVVAIIGFPHGNVGILVRFLWVYFMTIEAVSVLPQLRLVQNAKIVEPLTANYMFALGVSRFFSCANWIIMIIDTRGDILTHIGKGNLHILVNLLSEVIQTFILADFCYYYVKSVMEGQRMMKLPSIV